MKQLNIDYIGGLAVLAFAAFFWLQMDEEFTHFAIYFPERILPILAGFGLVLLVKGYLKPSLRDNFIRKINGNMLFAVLTGLIWVLILEWVGFVISSFAAVFILLWRYQPAARRRPADVAGLALLAAAEVGVMYLVFVKLLYVTLPVGRVFY